MAFLKVEISTKADWLQEQRRFLDTIEIIQPPEDGYAYMETTKLGDTKQSWQRVGRKPSER